MLGLLSSDHEADAESCPAGTALLQEILEISRNPRKRKESERERRRANPAAYCLQSIFFANVPFESREIDLKRRLVCNRIASSPWILRRFGSRFAHAGVINSFQLFRRQAHTGLYA